MIKAFPDYHGREKCRRVVGRLILNSASLPFLALSRLSWHQLGAFSLLRSDGSQVASLFATEIAEEGDHCSER
jgi:hypothetical protein